MRAPFMAGAFPFPVKYGYATVGRVESGRPTAGPRRFRLHPHQSLFTLPADAVVPVPDGVPPARAVLAANMETALNAVWDGAPGPADRIAVVGGGLVGLAGRLLCARLPGAEVTVVDIAPARAALARALGAGFALPDAAPGDCDLVFHASASAAGLATALRLAGEEATVVELSWYGSGDVAAPLGGAFHSRRLRLVSSQVGKVAPSHRSRWTHARRLAAALALLDDPALDALARARRRFRGPAGAVARDLRAGLRSGLPADPLSRSNTLTKRKPVYAVEVRDQIMIAHSFRGEVFGPAQELHGATFVIRVAFLADELDAHGIVVDIGRAHEVLKGRCRSAQLSQPRRAAAVQGHQHHHRVPDPAPVRSPRRCGARGQARPRRPRTQIDPRHRRGIAGRARLVRGAVVVKEARVRGAGRSCDPDRRLRL